MKKIVFLLLAFVFVVSLGTQAQTYRMNKQTYNYRLYTPQFGDPYNPALSGVLSFLIPGLGQMVSGEVGRGIAFLGGYVGCGILVGVGAATAVETAYNYQYGYYYTSAGPGTALLLIGTLGMIAVDIWSIVDAVRVAKVNNMYIQDLRKTSNIEFELAPYAEAISLNGEVITPVGLSLRMKF